MEGERKDKRGKCKEDKSRGVQKETDEGRVKGGEQTRDKRLRGVRSSGKC